MPSKTPFDDLFKDMEKKPFSKEEMDKLDKLGLGELLKRAMGERDPFEVLGATKETVYAGHRQPNTDYEVVLIKKADDKWIVANKNNAWQMHSHEEFDNEEEAMAYFKVVINPNSLGKC